MDCCCYVDDCETAESVLQLRIVRRLFPNCCSYNLVLKMVNDSSVEAALLIVACPHTTEDVCVCVCLSHSIVMFKMIDDCHEDD